MPQIGTVIKTRTFEKTASYSKTCLVAFFILTATAAHSGAVRLGTGSRLWLEGDSSLHPFTSTATALSVSGVWAGELNVQEFILTIPVAGLKSNKEALDRNLRKALKAESNPEILFHLTNLLVILSEKGSFNLQADGTLQVAGNDKNVRLEMNATREVGGWRVAGQKTLKMSDFGIKPPSLMLGILRTRDEIIVHYDFLLDE